MAMLYVLPQRRVYEAYKVGFALRKAHALTVWPAVPRDRGLLRPPRWRQVGGKPASVLANRSFRRMRSGSNKGAESDALTSKLDGYRTFAVDDRTPRL
jgi:hypothetical protein